MAAVLQSVESTFCQRALSLTEKSHTRINLKCVATYEPFSSVRFWGKITGTVRDYIIVEAVPKKGARQPVVAAAKYYLSTDDGLSFSQVPIVEPWMHAECMKLCVPFTGDIAYVYDTRITHQTKKKPKPAGDDEDDEDDGEDDEEDAEDEKEPAGEAEAEAVGGQAAKQADPDEGDVAPPVKPDLTELDRLAWTVSQIKKECWLVPKGALRLTSKKNIVRNPRFKGFSFFCDFAFFNLSAPPAPAGLSAQEATKLASYLHWRTPQSQQAISVFRRVTALNEDDFLDPVTDDLPKGCWRLRDKLASTDMCVKIRSLLWRGFECVHWCDTPRFEQGYFGNGIRQNDLLFLL